MNHIDTMKQALEALEWCEPAGTVGYGGITARKAAVDALRSRLAQPEQEPVAVCEYCERERPVIHPPQRQPLTDGQIEALFAGVDSEDKGRFAIVRAFARAIEQAHGITGDKR